MEKTMNQAGTPAEPTRAARRVAARRASELADIGPLPVVQDPVGQVIIAALTPRAIKCRGKVNPQRFFPGFCERLAERGYASQFVFTPEELSARTTAPNSTIIHLYNEENIIPTDDEVAEAESRAQSVFNALPSGRIIGKKAPTNHHLTAQGILMPSLAPQAGVPVFSNAAASTSKPAWVVNASDGLDETRYNTEFIDTTVEVEGRAYLTTLRLMAVGPEVVLSYLGIRAKDLRRPSVHGVSTPRNAALYNAVYDQLFVQREAELRDLAVRLNKVLGPGFYHHDLLIEAGTGRILVCEVGYKFDPYAFSEHMAPISDQVPSLAPLYDGSFARASADAVIAVAEAA
jgi:hypothetical protein